MKLSFQIDSDKQKKVALKGQPSEILRIVLRKTKKTTDI